MRQFKKPRWRWLALSLLVTAFVTIATGVPVAMLVLPGVAQRQSLAQLAAQLDNPEVEPWHRALAHVAARAHTDAAVADTAIAHLATTDKKRFNELMQVLDMTGVWNRDRVGLDAWLRHLTYLLDETEPEARIIGVQSLAELVDLANDQQAGPKIVALLGRAVADADGEVRFNALFVVAELAGVASDQRAYIRLLATLANDPLDPIARQAWLFQGLLGAPLSIDADWHRRSPAVAEAVIWALTRANPSDPTAALSALEQEGTHIVVSRMAAYALGQLPAEVKPAAQLRDLLQAQLKRHAEADPLLTWRLILAQQPKQIAADRAQTAYVVNTLWPVGAQAEPDPRTLAALHVDAAWMVANNQLGRLIDEPLARLAVYEGLSPDQTKVALETGMPDLLRLAGAAATVDLDPTALLPVLASNQTSLRDWASIVAAQRLNAAQNEHLIDQLLGAIDPATGRPVSGIHFEDRAKMSGALLAGLTGLRPELLQQKEAAEDMPYVREVMRMGLWMQGHDTGQDMPSRVQALMLQPDAPQSTFLVGLLIMRPRQALDYLLNPRGEPRLNLDELLFAQRWWHVLHPLLLRDASDPTGTESGNSARASIGPPQLSFWSDPDAQTFEIELLRNWYLVHRHTPALSRRPTIGRWSIEPSPQAGANHAAHQ